MAETKSANKSSAEQSLNRESKLRWAVLGLGALVFLLVFFADKTNLSNRPSLVTAEVGEGNNGQGFAEGLPPLAPEPKMDQWLNSLAQAKDQEKIRILDSIILNLQSRQRFAYAAEYAEALLVEDRSLSIQVLAGELNLKASQLGYISQDSALFKKYSQRGIRYLNDAVNQDPENHDARIMLARGYVQSGDVSNVMLGVQQLRRVLESAPDKVEASFELGLLSIQSGQFERAVERFQRVLEIETANEEARYQLAFCLAQLGRNNESASLLQKVLDQSDDEALKQQAQQLLNAVK